jgi:hypothetical protein
MKLDDYVYIRYLAHSRIHRISEYNTILTSVHYMNTPDDLITSDESSKFNHISSTDMYGLEITTEKPKKKGEELLLKYNIFDASVYLVTFGFMPYNMEDKC